MSRTCEIDYVNEAMPDYIGFVFAKSRRSVSAIEAEQLRMQLKAPIIPIGVFTNSPIYEIESLYRKGIISIAQLHGTETEAYIKQLKKSCDIPVIKVIKVKEKESLGLLEPSIADFFLFDNYKGGSGHSFDWDSIPQCEKPFFLAGGINCSNLEQAISYHPYCVDISSGAETNGIKDQEKIMELVKRIEFTY